LNDPYVMIVDDDVDVRDSVRTVLEDEGYRVVELPHGKAALDHLRAGGRPFVILLDLMMPVMDGAAFRQHQRSDPALRDIPVVLVTAAGARAAAAFDADAMLHKPIPIEEILETVARYRP
jgi:two-component system chemotaxis response regulator CheY